jgi:hypothetical protein
MDLNTFFRCNGVQEIGNIFEPDYIGLDKVVGLRVWVCDFRLNDNFDIKPLRSVKPTEVVICLNEDFKRAKKVYHSPVHFRPVVGDKVLSRVIAPYDNTGCRSYPGTCLNIFLTAFECFECYINQCDKAIDGYKEHLKIVEAAVNRQIAVIEANKKIALEEYSK